MALDVCHQDSNSQDRKSLGDGFTPKACSALMMSKWFSVLVISTVSVIFRSGKPLDFAYINA
jgi:hypothetical protein